MPSKSKWQVGSGMVSSVVASGSSHSCRSASCSGVRSCGSNLNRQSSKSSAGAGLPGRRAPHGCLSANGSRCRKRTARGSMMRERAVADGVPSCFSTARSISMWSFSEKRGARPSSSARTHPADQTSTDGPYRLLPQRSSGGRYHRVTAYEVNSPSSSSRASMRGWRAVAGAVRLGSAAVGPALRAAPARPAADVEGAVVSAAAESLGGPLTGPPGNGLIGAPPAAQSSAAPVAAPTPHVPLLSSSACVQPSALLKWTRASAAVARAAAAAAAAAARVGPIPRAIPKSAMRRSQFALTSRFDGLMSL
mmetsp:Transcript_29856/g.95095  ORF Transcript_29856/g.95095 Transcript_29856/m.95095 type:complete len:307 (-) Transcript_29856:915-1835(-)